MCGKSRTDGTDVLMFTFTIDLIAENRGGPPMVTMEQLDRIVRRDAFEKSIVLPIKKYKMFIVRKNGFINISNKKTPKIKKRLGPYNTVKLFHCHRWRTTKIFSSQVYGEGEHKDVSSIRSGLSTHQVIIMTEKTIVGQRNV